MPTQACEVACNCEELMPHVVGINWALFVELNWLVNCTLGVVFDDVERSQGVDALRRTCRFHATRSAGAGIFMGFGELQPVLHLCEVFQPSCDVEVQILNNIEQLARQFDEM